MGGRRGNAIEQMIFFLSLAVSDRNWNSHIWPKPNIRQLKTTEYSVWAEYSALFQTFGQNSQIYIYRVSTINFWATSIDI
jgi:hypothetical protein